MVLKALYAGVSGLRAEGEALGVVGENIANVNTTGYKRQRALFEDVLGRSIMGGGNQAGAGVIVGDIQQVFQQGALATTGVSTDLALSGDGFFVVDGNVQGIAGQWLTRAGQFSVNANGFLVNPAGLHLQGYAGDGSGGFAATVSSIAIPTGSLPANPTTEIDLTANLDAQEAVMPPVPPFDPQDPGNTSNYATSITTYDSLGQAHTVDVYFRKTGANAWEFHVLADGDEVTSPAPGAPGENVVIGTGTLSFTDTGALNVETGLTAGVTFSGAAAQSIELDFGDSIADGGTGIGQTTQFAADSTISAQSQNGYSSGDFAGLSVDGQGVVTALFSNGKELAVGQLAIAKFRSNQGLARAGGNLWKATRDSGDAVLGTAGNGGRGAVNAGAIEGSNVDLAEEFVGLIQHQRAFSANSRTITTADEMLQELMNIKR